MKKKTKTNGNKKWEKKKKTWEKLEKIKNHSVSGSVLAEIRQSGKLFLPYNRQLKWSKEKRRQIYFIKRYYVREPPVSSKSWFG